MFLAVFLIVLCLRISYGVDCAMLIHCNSHVMGISSTSTNSCFDGLAGAACHSAQCPSGCSCISMKPHLIAHETLSIDLKTYDEVDDGSTIACDENKTTGFVCDCSRFEGLGSRGTQELGRFNGNTSNIPDIELSALYDIFNSTDGNNWQWRSEPSAGKKWEFNAASNPCAEHWQGLTCSESSLSAHITNISLSGYNLNGSLPFTISNFSELLVLDLSHNRIVGKIPSSVGGLFSLQELILHHNSFTGFIPNSFGSLRHVQKLHIGNNYLSGSIPDSVGDMIALQFFTINYNNISGTIPTRFNQLSNLRNLEMAYLTKQSGPGLHGSINPLSTIGQLTTLSLEYNSLSGTIPAALGNLTNITSLDLDHNKFTGPLPASLGQLHRLISFYIDHNYLSGTIPASYGNMTRLKDLYLYFTQLSGKIPDSLGDLSELVVLDLSGNHFSGSIPATFHKLTKLYGFIANNNEITGTIPAFFGELPRLGNVYVGDNQFSGTIPENFGSLEKLETIGLNSNGITGTIPSTLGQLRFLNTLQINNNFLMGHVPDALTLLHHLVDFEVNNNFLTGTLPRNLSAMTRLGVLRVQNNFLTGDLDGLFNPNSQSQLTSVQINDNQFTGLIPAPVFLAPALSTFAATINCFHGTIPQTVCSAVNLVSLVVDGLSSASACRHTLIPVLSESYVPTHSMHGTIPQCLFALPLLTTLHLSGNKLSGSIPNDVTVTTSLSDLSLSFNALTNSIPDVIQGRQWMINLDLSNNRLAGELISNFPAAATPQAALALQNNRLSGRIPDTITEMKNVSILGSNLFSCELDGHDLPKHDDSSHNSRSNYQCGSTEFEILYYLWVSIAVVVLLGVVVCMANGIIKNYTQWLVWIGKCTPVAATPDDAPDDAPEGAPGLVLDQEPVQQQTHLSEIFILFHELDSLVKVGVVCVLFIVVIFVPLYAVLSTYYGTHMHAYAWKVSAAFLAGVQPFIVLTVFWLIFLFVLIVLYILFVQLNCRGNNSSSNTSSAGGSLVVDASSTATVDAASPGTSVGKHWWFRLQVNVLFVFVNTVIVVGVNVAYVYVAIHYSSKAQVAMQILLSLFKLGWNNVCTAYLLQYTVQLVHGVGRKQSILLSRNAFTTVRIGVNLLNNIVIPCAVVAAIAPACFYYVFVSAAPVVSSYTYQVCDYISPTTGSCLTYGTDTSTSSYRPPFTYNYQCSSSLITYYSPAFVNVCICNAFLTPLFHAAVVYLHKHAHNETFYGYWRWGLECLLPAVLKLHPPPLQNDSNHLQNDYKMDHQEDHQEDHQKEPPTTDPSVVGQSAMADQYGLSTGRWLDGNQLIITLLGYLGVLFTFGAVFPPLAVAFACTLVSVNVCAKLRVGRFITVTQALGKITLVRELETELQGRQASQQLWQGIWMILTVCCWFYMFFLFDTLGNSVGFDGAYWVLIVFPLLPFVLYFVANEVKKVYSKKRRDSPEIENSVSQARGRTVHAGSNVGMEMMTDGEQVEDDSATYNVMNKL